MTSPSLFTPTGLTLEERLRRVEDRQEITELRGHYCHLLDERNWGAFVDLFTPDGYFKGLEEARGHEALMAFFSQRVPTLIDDFWHFCSNGTIELDGDRATGRISLDYLSVVGGVSHVSAGHYDDVFERIDGRWRFKSRVITFYFLTPLEKGWAGLPFPGRTP